MKRTQKKSVILRKPKKDEDVRRAIMVSAKLWADMRIAAIEEGTKLKDWLKRAIERELAAKR